LDYFGQSHDTEPGEEDACLRPSSTFLAPLEEDHNVSAATDALIDVYLAAPAALRRAVADMTPEQLRARPVPGRWSTLEVVAHLCDSDQAYCHRIKRAIAEDRPLLIGYDETRFTASLAYHDRDPSAEIDLMEAMRRQTAGELRRLSEEAWDRAGVHNERGLETVRHMVELEAEHVEHHLRHVREKRKALGPPEVA
jgi:uncharacterized damage-inducible protein DinB